MGKMHLEKDGFIFLSLCTLWLISLSVLASGCATRQIKPETTITVPPKNLPQPKDKAKSYVRIFPDFIAVIARPGDTFASLSAKYLNDSSLDWFLSEFNDTNSLIPGQGLIIPLHDYEKGGLSIKRYQTVPVLTYHKFARNNADTMTVSARSFEEQMRFLKKNGYHVITMDEFFDFLDFKVQIPKKSVVITIDDGWRSAYDIAYPILKKYGYPATLFVYTDFILQSEKTLDWARLSEMKKNGIDIQCHTKTHRNLNRKEEQESFRGYFESVKKELTESAEIIKKRLNKEVKYLAYPYGETNSLVVALLVKLGYRGAFTVDRVGNPFFADNYRIHRSMIYGDFDLKEFERNLTAFSSDELN